MHLKKGRDNKGKPTIRYFTKLVWQYATTMLLGTFNVCVSFEK